MLTTTKTAKATNLTTKMLLAGLAGSMVVAGLAAPAGAMRGHGRTVAKPGFVSATGDKTSARMTAFTATTMSRGFNGEANPKRHVVQVNVPKSLKADGFAAGRSVKPRTIVGGDNRTRVTNTSSSWARQTVLIYTQRDGWCTGFLIGPDTVATAAHCVYHNEVSTGKGWWDYRNMTVYPGYNGVNAPYGTCGVRDLYTNNNWINVRGSWDFDYGVIKLNCKIGNSLGWYGWVTSGYTTATTLYSQGFPSDKPSYSMWVTSGNILSARSFGQFLTNIDFIAGQSGSPVWQNFSGCGQCAMGIMSWYPSTAGAPNGMNRINANSSALFAQVKALA